MTLSIVSCYGAPGYMVTVRFMAPQEVVRGSGRRQWAVPHIIEPLHLMNPTVRPHVWEDDLISCLPTNCVKSMLV